MLGLRNGRHYVRIRRINVFLCKNVGNFCRMMLKVVKDCKVIVYWKNFFFVFSFFAVTLHRCIFTRVAYHITEIYNLYNYINKVTKMKSKIVYLMLCLALVGCGKKNQMPEADNEYAVETVKASESDLNVSYPATIKGMQDIEVRPKISGFITKMLVDEGAFVRKGQVLFTIDDVQYREAVRSAEANIRQLSASINSQVLTVQNKKLLNSKKIISDYDLKVAQNELASLKAQFAAAKAQLIQARDNLYYCTIKSPADGVIGLIPYRVGSLVSSSSAEALTTVSNISKMYVYFSMTEKQVLEMTREKGGTTKAISELPEIQLQLSDGSLYELKGKVSTLGGVIDEATGSVSMRATFDNPNRVLRSGGSGSVLVPLHMKNAIVVPQKAVFEIQDRKFVYLVGADNKVKSVQIEVLDQNDGTNYVVTSGLKIGDRMVVEGVSNLKEGTVIKPITPAQSEAKQRKAQQEVKDGKMPM